MPSFFLPYLNSQIHAVAAGEGEELLICLHGFGENAETFMRLKHTLGNLFTIVALDLPLHGETMWNEPGPFEPQHLADVIRLILTRYQRSEFSLMGYSMGGRAALCTVEQMASQIKRLYLLAADGLRDNPWHTFVTQTRIGSRLFKYITYHPQLYFGLLDFWKKLGLLNESIYKFAHNRMSSLEKREQVYKVWSCMRRMRPNRPRCKQLLASNHIPTLLIFGKYDRIIPPVLGVRFMDGRFPCKMLVLEKGHQLLSEELGETITDNYE
jgi:pimeloyl-ACP methyl ester carboxylesterase